MIEIKNLSVRYGDFYALNHITLDIPRGTWTCLVGPNGAGKTTFQSQSMALKFIKTYVTWHLFRNVPKFLQAWTLRNM
jgi:ABC-type multidrug transport system ATPase subunit